MAEHPSYLDRFVAWYHHVSGSLVAKHGRLVRNHIGRFDSCPETVSEEDKQAARDERKADRDRVAKEQKADKEKAAKDRPQK